MTRNGGTTPNRQTRSPFDRAGGADFNRRQFEQEVADEIGAGLGRTRGRAPGADARRSPADRRNGAVTNAPYERTPGRG